MNVHGKDIKIFCGNAYPKAAEEIAKSLGLPVGKCTVGHFADGEVSMYVGIQCYTPSSEEYGNNYCKCPVR